jgi:proline dehydrogenase
VVSTAARATETDQLSSLRERIRAATVRSEPEAVKQLLESLAPVESRLDDAKTRAARWVEVARADKRPRPLVNSLLEQFPLDSVQGKALMSLAEALLRTSDPKRADQLISERLTAIRSAGATGSDDLLLRTAFALLGSASRLLPDVAAELSGRFSLASVTKPFVRSSSRSSAVAMRSGRVSST